MAPLIFLLVTFAALYFTNRYGLQRHLSLGVIGRISLAVMLVVTGVSHFTNTEEMVAMMPDMVPAKRWMVYFTGILELTAVAGLLWDRFSRLTSVLLIVFFIAVLPANIVGSMKQVQYGGMQYGIWYLVFRIPLQAFFVWWTYYFGIRHNRER